MSLEETKKVLDEVRRLESLGNEEAASSLLRTIPLDPEYANNLKRFNGIQWLMDRGYNLTDAVGRYGDRWLNA